ncbi:sulfite exporter TauE/SafE family protein [Rothia sp. CCM 9418]|uniref:sulfite exporter TauE/SafE family protein n=1 Tax=Rothia sp. CCM 9418 TaxID=3402661 RepID=UPI003ADA79BF
MLNIIGEYSLISWALLGCAAFLVGISKTMLPGVNLISVIIFASLMPAKISTGALLILLIIGDISALVAYRKHAHWKTLLTLVPAVLCGLFVGAAYLFVSNDQVIRRSIGWILLALMVLTLLQRQSRHSAQNTSQKFAWFYGGLGGFTTMVANAGGPVMNMYFLASRFNVQLFLGTTAWFFAVMNVLKLPFSVSLGLVNPHTLTLGLVLLPLLLLGSFIGWFYARRIPQKVFERLVIVVTWVGALYLVF